MKELIDFDSSSAADTQHDRARVTAIVPTMAVSARASMIKRAVRSLVSDARTGVKVVVVVNGGRHDPSIIEYLQSMHDVDVRMVSEAGLPNALRVGREAVRTEYFCFLDDDDEYLPGAIDLRVKVMDERPQAGLVVTNGYRCVDGDDIPAARHIGRVESDPMRALFGGNWLASCGGLFRSSAVGEEHFRDIFPLLEWTWIAFSLCKAGCEVAAVDVPTYRIHDTPGSASKSAAFGRARASLYARMLAANPSGAVRELILDHRRAALHNIATSSARRGQVRQAWVAHLTTLRAPGGWRYLPFTRHLLGVTLRSFLSVDAARRSK